LVEIGWSGDSTQVYTIDTGHHVAVWSMQPNLGKSVTKGVKGLTLLAKLDPSSFQRAQTELEMQTSIRESMPCTGCFHPAATILGTQPSIVLAMLNGDVIKCNSSAIERAVIAKPPLPLTGNHAQMASQSTVTGAYFTTAERFVGHNEPVIFVGFGDGDIMVTVDVAGIILSWPYDAEKFTGFNWFQPGKKCSLNLDYTFEADEATKPKTVFPPADLVVPANPLFDDAYLEAVENAAQVVAALPEVAAAPTSTEITKEGTMVLTYAPLDIKNTDATVQCTVLEYSVAGAGAGLLRRHATQKATPNRSARGSLVAAAFTHLREQLVVMVSTEAKLESSQTERRSLAVVGLRVETMEWMSLRIEIGAAPTSTPALAVRPEF
jgi:hypothetical protein